MAFPRARLKRFNEMQDKTPGVGAYNLVKDKQVKDKAGSLARINETMKNCRDKALTATEKGTLPKHIEEIHTKLAHAQERVLDLEILKMGWDKQRELIENEKSELRQKLAQLEIIQEKLNKAEKDRHEQEQQIKTLQQKRKELEEQTEKLHFSVTEANIRIEEFEKEKVLLATELGALKESDTEIECVAELQRDEITSLKKSLTEVQNELRTNKEESELLTITHEKESRDLMLRMSMVEEAHLKLEKESADIAEDLTNKLLICEGKKTRLESENEKLTSLLEQSLGDVEELTQHVLFAQEKQHASTKEIELVRHSHEMETEEFENEKQFLTSQIQSLIIRCEEGEDNLKKVSETKAIAFEALRTENNQKLCELEERNEKLEGMVFDIEKDKKEMLAREHHLKEKLIVLENTQKHLESESSALTQDLTKELIAHEEKIRELELENDDLAQKLDHALEKSEVVETSSKLALEKAKTSYSEDLARFESDSVELHHKQKAMWAEKMSTAQEENKQLASEVRLAKEEILLCGQEANQLQSRCDEILAENEKLTQHVSQLENELESLKQEPALALHDREDYEHRLASSDHEIEGLTVIISEMSEKIEQFECDRSEILMELEDSKAKYDELEKRMEPFKEVLDEFELERQLLHDRDKFTDDQLEMLKQECIKNMGHQNHKQRIKYLGKIKQENLSLQKTVHELQVQTRRQEATIKKLKGKTIDEADSTKIPCPKTPLKEGNRL